MTPFDLADEPDGATPLAAEDLAGLVPTWIATRDELNEVEQENIAKALIWAEGHGPKTLDALLTDEMMRQLHRRMFGDVWKWAGEYRTHGTNIGAPWHYISTQLRGLLSDVRAQTAEPERLPWSEDELAVRFHHRLVWIHPFSNGNGRHARLAADLLAARLARPPFTWGGADLVGAGDARERYLAALRTADSQFDYQPLLGFARS